MGEDTEKPERYQEKKLISGLSFIAYFQPLLAISSA